MFDLNELKKDTSREVVLPIDCLELAPGAAVPTLTIKLTDATRKRMTEAFQECVKFHGKLGESEGSLINDRLGLSLRYADACVVDSQNLFSENGVPAKHQHEAFRSLLIRYTELRTWFLNAISAEMESDRLIQFSAKAETEKNS